MNIIIGANGGIGSNIAKILQERDEDLYLLSRKPVDNTSQQNDVIDVLNFEETHAKVSKIAQSHAIKALYYCVGSIDLKPFIATKAQDYIDSYNLNVLGAVAAIQGAIGSLKQNNGSVVLFSTIAAQKGFKNHAIIAASKSGLEGLSVSLAAEYAPYVRFNCIAPSLTNTPLAKDILSNEKMAESLAKQHPMKRLGLPNDIASLASFLGSEKSSWITGQIFHVDGGYSSLKV